MNKARKKWWVRARVYHRLLADLSKGDEFAKASAAAYLKRYDRREMRQAVNAFARQTLPNGSAPQRPSELRVALGIAGEKPRAS